MKYFIDYDKERKYNTPCFIRGIIILKLFLRKYMNIINKVILVGHVGQDPEVRYTPDGTTITNISLATSEIWQDKFTGEKKERIEWHRVVLWGKKAEIARDSFRKGAKIYIEGILRTRKWKDQEGLEQSITAVIVNVDGCIKMLENFYKEVVGSTNTNNKRSNGWVENQYSDQGVKFSQTMEFDDNTLI